MRLISGQFRIMGITCWMIWLKYRKIWWFLFRLQARLTIRSAMKNWPTFRSVYRWHWKIRLPEKFVRAGRTQWWIRMRFQTAGIRIWLLLSSKWLFRHSTLWLGVGSYGYSPDDNISRMGRILNTLFMCMHFWFLIGLLPRFQQNKQMELQFFTQRIHFITETGGCLRKRLSKTHGYFCTRSKTRWSKKPHALCIRTIKCISASYADSWLTFMPDSHVHLKTLLPVLKKGACFLEPFSDGNQTRLWSSQKIKSFSSVTEKLGISRLFIQCGCTFHQENVGKIHSGDWGQSYRYDADAAFLQSVNSVMKLQCYQSVTAWPFYAFSLNLLLLNSKLETPEIKCPSVHFRVWARRIFHLQIFPDET